MPQIVDQTPEVYLDQSDTRTSFQAGPFGNQATAGRPFGSIVWTGGGPLWASSTGSRGAASRPTTRSSAETDHGLGPARKDDRRVMDGIFFVLRSGCPWRDLPQRYGPYTTCYNRWNRWSKDGSWASIVSKIQELAGPGGGGPATKIHAAADSAGRPLALRLSPGQAADCAKAPELPGGLVPGEAAVADKAGGIAAVPLQVEPEDAAGAGPRGLCRPQPDRAFLREDQGVSAGGDTVREADQELSVRRDARSHALSAANSGGGIYSSPQPSSAARLIRPRRRLHAIWFTPMLLGQLEIICTTQPESTWQIEPEIEQKQHDVPVPRPLVPAGSVEGQPVNADEAGAADTVVQRRHRVGRASPRMVRRHHRPEVSPAGAPAPAPTGRR